MLLDTAAPETFAAGWYPPIVEVGDVCGSGSFIGAMNELASTIESHYRHLVDHDLLRSRIRRKMAVELNAAIRASVLDVVLKQLADDGEMERMIDKLLLKEADPYTLAEEVAREYLKRP